jgi:hypothetical protein
VVCGAASSHSLEVSSATSVSALVCQAFPSFPVHLDGALLLLHRFVSRNIEDGNAWTGGRRAVEADQALRGAGVATAPTLRLPRMVASARGLTSVCTWLQSQGLAGGITICWRQVRRTHAKRVVCAGRG